MLALNVAVQMPGYTPSVNLTYDNTDNLEGCRVAQRTISGIRTTVLTKERKQQASTRR